MYRIKINLCSARECFVSEFSYTRTISPTKFGVSKLSLVSLSRRRYATDARRPAAKSDYCLGRRSGNAIISRLASPRACRSSAILTAIRVTLKRNQQVPHRFWQWANNKHARADNSTRLKYLISPINSLIDAIDRERRT